MATTIPTNSFCKDCLRITASGSNLLKKHRGSGARSRLAISWVKNRWKSPGSYTSEAIGPFVFAFKGSFGDLEESAKNGCNSCRFFIATVGEFGEATPKEGEIFLVRHTEEIGADTVRLGGPKPATTPTERYRSGDYICLYEGTTPLARYNLCMKGLKAVHELGITRRPVPVFAGDEESLQYVHKRLQDCCQNHPKCTNRRPAYLPSRLLELTKLDSLPGTRNVTIRLIGTAGKLDPNERYTALSHCWGPPSTRVIKTTLSNLEAHMNGISFSDLSPNFRDAVIVTLSLGIKHLWIDSLCIIQDSTNDWASESGSMADIYRSATLTIAAASSENSGQGFLSTIRSRLLARKSLLLPGQEGTPEDNKLILQLYRKHFESSSLRSDAAGAAVEKHCAEPLGTRAWTLQERILSRRTIFYESTQLFWECQSGRYMEGWMMNLEQMGLNRPTKGNQLHRVEKPTFSNEQSFLGTKDWYGPVCWRHQTLSRYSWWYEMLEDYRSRDLTVATDALPALSGLAGEFATKTGDEYVAGIWRGDLLGGLTWRLEVLKEETLQQRHQKYVQTASVGPQSVEECFAPSWSWASVLDRNGRIFRPSSQGGDVLASHHVAENAKAPSIPREFSSNRAKVIEVNIVPRSTDKMGHVGSASLVLDGLCRMIKVRRRKLDADHPYAQWPGLFIFEMVGLEKHLNQYLFPSVDHPHWLEKRLGKSGKWFRPEYLLTCLFLKNTSGLHCLLLDKVDVEENSVLYRRCGVMNIEYQLREFEGGWKRERVTII